MYDTELYEELSEWDEVLSKARTLSRHLFDILDDRVRGMSNKQIAAKRKIEVRSVNQYNNSLNTRFNIVGLTPSEKTAFFVRIAPVVDHIKQNPYIMAEIDANVDDVIIAPLPAYTERTFRLRPFVGTDPNDAKTMLRFIIFIIAFIAVLIIIVFTLLAAAAGYFTTFTP